MDRLILRVLWNDAAHNGSTMWSLELKDFAEREYLIDSVGWLVAATEKGLVIAQDFNLTGNSSRHHSRIPAEYVRQIEILKDDGDAGAFFPWMTKFLPKRKKVKAARKAR
jgi:hypothetical protein